MTYLARFFAALLVLSPVQAQPAPPYLVDGDSIPLSLNGQPGDPARGRALVLNRQKSLCILCHAASFADPHMQGDMAPDLAGAGARWSAGQLRLRLVEPQRFNPATLMPSAYASEGLANVARRYAGQSVLAAPEIEDIVAFLASLKQ